MTSTINFDALDHTTQFQFLSSRTIGNFDDFAVTPEVFSLLNMCLGLSGEAGEFIEIVKKQVFHGKDVDLEKVQEEIGDILWYIAGICTMYDLNMATIMVKNHEKLLKRYPEGFSEEASAARVDVESEPAAE